MRHAVRYIGKLHGRGLLIFGPQAPMRAEYDFEGFQNLAGQITASGELCLPPEDLKTVFAHRTVQLRAEDGQIFDLRFSRQELSPSSDIAHVDLIGNLSSVSGWAL